MEKIHDQKIKELETKAQEIRKDIITMLAEAGSGHTAGPLGMADIFSALYFHVLNHKPDQPDWEDRDRLILSNGHICPVRYTAMAHAGYFPQEELTTLRKFSSRLQGHPEKKRLPGIETTSGPLGSGLGIATGIAKAAIMDHKKYHIYCIMSDGEQQAGNLWESAMFAAHNKLANITGIIDRNYIQIGGSTEDIMGLDSLKDKYEAFDWHVLEIDGHNIEEFIDACNQTKAVEEKPSVIIAHTIPGKGVASIEKDYTWHGKAPSPEEAEDFKDQIESDS
jgi:transketolase